MPAGRAPPRETLMIGYSCTPSPVMNGAARVAAAADGRALRGWKVVRPPRLHRGASSVLVSRSRAMPAGGRRSAVAQYLRGRR